MISEFFIPASPGHIPGADGYFGAFGGKFIPEALVAAVDEVAVEYERAKADPAFAAEFEELLVHYVGRPSPLTEVPRFAERLLASTEGIIPAIESAHALAGAIDLGTELGQDGLILVNLSGRGDKDMDTAARYVEQDADAARAAGVSK